MFGAVTSDQDYLMYKPMDSPEWIELKKFIKVVKCDDKPGLELLLRKSMKGMMKAGAAKTADIMIP